MPSEVASRPAARGDCSDSRRPSAARARGAGRSELVVLLDGREDRSRSAVAGTADVRLFRPKLARRPGRLSNVPSMPLAAAEHPHGAIDPFIWGLLPDNEHVLAAWGRRFQVSPRNPFALVAHVGEDCPGAVQFVRPERLEAATRNGPPEVDWLTEAQVAERLRRLRIDIAAWRSPGDVGQFSLAGAQPKTALLFDLRQRMRRSAGDKTPTSHILKPTHPPDLDGHAGGERSTSAFWLGAVPRVADRTNVGKVRLRSRTSRHRAGAAFTDRVATDGILAAEEGGESGTQGGRSRPLRGLVRRCTETAALSAAIAAGGKLPPPHSKARVS